MPAERKEGGRGDGAAVSSAPGEERRGRPGPKRDHGLDPTHTPTWQSPGVLSGPGHSRGDRKLPRIPLRSTAARTYLQGEFLLGSLVEDPQHLPIDAQAQHLAGDLVVIGDCVLSDLQARLDVELGERRRRLGRGGRRRAGERRRRSLAGRAGQHGARGLARRGGGRGRPLLRLGPGSPPRPARRRSLLRAGAGCPAPARLQARRVAGPRGSRCAPRAPTSPAPSPRRRALRGTRDGGARPGGKSPRREVAAPGAAAASQAARRPGLVLKGEDRGWGLGEAWAWGRGGP